MAQLIAPGICRYTVNGSFQGRKVANIVDMKIDTTGEITDRDEAIIDQGSRILSAWSLSMLTFLLADNYIAETVSWVDLDEDDGATGEMSSNDASDWPEAGHGLQAAMPGNVAMRVNKRTISRRGEKGGRMYLCGVTENETEDGNPNQLNSATISGGNPRLADFLTNVTKEAGGAGLPYTSQFHVVHTKGGLFRSSSEIIGLEFDPTLGSQRRRLR